MKALVPALSLLLGLVFAATAAPPTSAEESSVRTDDICAVRPDLCGANALRNKKRKKLKPAVVPRPPAPREPASIGLLREEDFVPTKADVQKVKAKKKKKSNDPLDDFWERDEQDALAEKEVQLLDIEREEIWKRKEARKPKPPPPPLRHQITFDDYLNANALILTGRNGTRQDAFTTVSRNRGAVIEVPADATVPNQGAPADGAGNGQSVKEVAPPPPPPPQ